MVTSRSDRQPFGGVRWAALGCWLRTPAGLALILWLMLMLLIPISNWTAGLDAVRQFVSYSVILQSVTVFLIMQVAWGWRRTLLTLLTIAVITFFVEMVGSKTGWLFGAYHYTDYLQPQLGGVPLLIPVAWFMMLPPAWAVAERFRHRPWLFLLIAAAAMTAWGPLPRSTNGGLGSLALGSVGRLFWHSLAQFPGVVRHRLPLDLAAAPTTATPPAVAGHLCHHLVSRSFWLVIFLGLAWTSPRWRLRDGRLHDYWILVQAGHR